VFQSAVCKTFLGAMGLTMTKQLESYKPLEAGVFWQTDPASGDKFLVPDFASSWSENYKWGNWMVTFVCKNLTNFATNWMPEKLDKHTYSEILQRIQASFMNFQKCV
jgi:hypothetical protein